jgi:hypothetical protein
MTPTEIFFGAGGGRLEERAKIFNHEEHEGHEMIREKKMARSE